jgi:hypothetical protein
LASFRALSELHGRSAPVEAGDVHFVMDFRAIDQAVGVLAGHSGWGANRNCKIAKGAESESIQLRAVRGILSDMLAVSRYSGLEARMAGLEAQARQRTGEANVSS